METSFLEVIFSMARCGISSLDQLKPLESADRHGPHHVHFRSVNHQV
jgi:hypothetical protein